MSAPVSFRERVLSRLEAARADSGPVPLFQELSELHFAQFERYFDLLRHWNRRINLTSLSLETLSDQAIDRLFVEPLCAARFLEGGIPAAQTHSPDRESDDTGGRTFSGPPERTDFGQPMSERGAPRWADLGSGGGSPAILLKIVCPSTHLTMVESRGRKAAFLREVVRELRLPDAAVENLRAEALTVVRAYDAITIRAVRLDSAFLAIVRSLLSPTGRLILFTPDSATASFEHFDLVEALEIPVIASRIALLTRKAPQTGP